MHAVGISAPMTRQQDRGFGGAAHITHGVGGSRSAEASVRKSTGRKALPLSPLDFGEGPPPTGRTDVIIHGPALRGVQIRTNQRPGSVLLSVNPLGPGANLHLGRRDSYLIGAEFYERL